MVAATLALAPAAGWIYTACAAGLGGWFLAEAHRLYRRADLVPAPASAPASASGRASGPGAPMRLFHLSIAYLTLLFAAIAVTALLPWGRW